MKIKITTDRHPWVNGSPQAKGALVDTDDATAATLIGWDWAEASRGRKKKVSPDANE
jgi:hypothetical protein